MKLLFCLIVVVTLWFGVCHGSVVDLDDNNFNQFIKENPVSIIKFFAPWCGHCKNLAPVWEEMGELSDLDFKVAKIDCTVSQQTCQAQEIRGYPTIKIFQNGLPTVHQGQRTIQAFKESVHKVVTSPPPVIKIDPKDCPPCPPCNQ
jgi:protein disulfide-isomerase-like protein